MTGVTQLDNIAYVVSAGSSTIKMYTADTLSPLGEDIHVEGMKDPGDIVACRHDRQLYVADWDCSTCQIWRVSADDHSKYVKWLTTLSSTQGFNVNTLSLTSQHLLVTSPPRSLHKYQTTNNRLPISVVQLPKYVKWLCHAVETSRGTFVVGHHGTSQDGKKDAV